ncbi:MAG: HAD family phosphatase [Bdellovibrionaceae bacterium]|nr:HAD family phosphatase [Bdellovibrionales bacterium]MCB9253196.1 HAD family phosphatase [Pseudobdellovibrionaceae bacterium]
MSTKPVRAIILDLGNVVLEISHAKMAAAFSALEPGKIRLVDEMEKWPEFDAFERGTMNETEFTEFLSQHWGVPLSQEAFRRAWNAVFVGPVFGIEAVLDYARRSLPTYALSNTSPSHIEYASATYPFLATFEKIFTSYELGCRKPERVIYERTRDAIGFPAEEMIFVDDRPENVAAAKSVGFQAFCCNNNSSELQRLLKTVLAVNISFDKRV